MLPGASQFLDLLRWQGGTVEIALVLITAEGLQELELIGRLDSFGDDLQSQAVCQRDNGTNDQSVLGLRRDLADEAPVDLLGTCCAARADNSYVACHADVSFTASDVRDVFLGEKQFARSIRLVPVDNTEVQPLFLEMVLRVAKNRAGARR